MSSKLTVFLMQFSVQISKKTSDKLESYSRTHRVKKQFLIESALLDFFRGLDELPAAVMLPTRMVVTERSSRSLAGLISGKRKPTHALVDFMRGGD